MRVDIMVMAASTCRLVGWFWLSAGKGELVGGCVSLPLRRPKRQQAGLLQSPPPRPSDPAAHQVGRHSPASGAVMSRQCSPFLIDAGDLQHSLGELAVGGWGRRRGDGLEGAAGLVAQRAAHSQKQRRPIPARQLQQAAPDSPS